MRSSHVCEMAASLAVDLRSTAKGLEDGACTSFEGLQRQLQTVCRLAIDAYMEQQGDEGKAHWGCELCVNRPASSEMQSCFKHRLKESTARSLLPAQYSPQHEPCTRF